MKNGSTLTSPRWWVLAWFVLALGVSMASPLVRPSTLELVCGGAWPGTGMGASVQLVELTDDVPTDALALDPYCLLCLTGGATPPDSLPQPDALALPAQNCCTSSRAAHVSVPDWRPPARAPPFDFSRATPKKVLP